MIRRVVCVVVLLTVAVPASAQEEVRHALDAASYVTAAVNPALALIDAWRAPAARCRLAQLAISEGVGNALTLTLKHFVASPRPCLGCGSDGMPSGHTMNATIGGSAHWPIGLAFAVSTGVLRHAAQRHTWPQVLAGAGVGLLADQSARVLRCAP